MRTICAGEDKTAQGWRDYSARQRTVHAEEMTLFETKLNLTPEQQAKTQVVSKLTPLADMFIVDAFAAAHRA